MKPAEGIGSRVSSSEKVPKLVAVAYYRGNTMLKVGTRWPDGGRGRGPRRGELRSISGQQSQVSPQRFQASIPSKSCAYVGECGTVVAWYDS